MSLNGSAFVTRVPLLVVIRCNQLMPLLDELQKQNNGIFHET